MRSTLTYRCNGQFFSQSVFTQGKEWLAREKNWLVSFFPTQSVPPPPPPPIIFLEEDWQVIYVSFVVNIILLQQFLQSETQKASR